MSNATPNEPTPDEIATREAADAVYTALLERVGEAAPEPRLTATRRAVELLGDPHRAAPVIHITGTNGKTSTSRMIDAILRSTGLRTGLLTSPHLVRFTERIKIDGRPVADAALVRNWREIIPFLDIADAELEREGEPPLTFFEAMTVLAFACFADAPVDVVVLEVGLGGEWDSTNVADADVAVFTPIDLDHQSRLGGTVGEIARTKSGIIKPAAAVVSAAQPAAALAELRRAAELTESTFALENEQFELLSTTVAVGGQLVSIRGLAGEYHDLALPVFGRHQAQNAALALSAVESFLGAGSVRLADEVIEAAFAESSSPGRLQPVGTEPTVIVDAAHNPHGARALVAALDEVFDFDQIVFVFAALGDKDIVGVLRELDESTTHIIVTSVDSERAVPAEQLALTVAEVLGPERMSVQPRLDDALDDARTWAGEGEKRAVVVTGSIVLVGEAMAIAADREWSGS